MSKRKFQREKKSKYRVERMKLLDFTCLDSLLKMSFDYTAIF